GHRHPRGHPQHRRRERGGRGDRDRGPGGADGVEPAVAAVGRPAPDRRAIPQGNPRRLTSSLVMRGLDPRIPRRWATPCVPDRDARDKPGHDEGLSRTRQRTIASPMRMTIPNITAAIRKKSANRINEMRLATTDTLVRPSAPATSAMIRKMIANFSMAGVRDFAPAR